MLIATTTASAICGISRNYYQRCMKALGVKPARRQGKGPGGACWWSLRSVLALLAFPTLEKLGCDEEHAELFARRLLSFPSDEQLEAIIQGGRSYLMLTGRVCAPELFTWDQVQDAKRTYDASIASLGLVIQPVDISVLMEQIQAAARTLTTQTAE